MALDCSFCLHSEYNRFLARCPRLGSIPKFAALSVKGDLLMEEEVVNSVAELFLHPTCTIPLLGCFRPISTKIVKKAVALLRLVPNLRSDTDEVEKVDEIPGRGENSGDAEVSGVIEYYVRRGRGLYLHELACLAFCRSVDLAPFLMGSVLSYFEFAPPPFQRILTMQPDVMLTIKAAALILDATRTSYRLLLMEQEIFSRLWNWSCFVDLVEQLAKVVFDSDDAFCNNILDLRWCGMQILTVILKFNDTQPENKSLGNKDSLSCLLRWKEFCQDVSLEKAGWYLEPAGGNIVDTNRNFDFSYENCLQSVGLDSLPISSALLVKTEPSATKRRPESWRRELASGSPFILTSSLKKSFEIVLLAVHQKWPVLLYGPAGAGKTALISKLAQDTGNRVLSIHVDDQIDTKTLVGSYVCTEQPGEFRWQPGSLTQAILNGLWVLFEDIDKAPMDMQSILLPLLEGTNSFTPGHGEAIRVAEGFRMFSTITSSKTNVSQGTQYKNLLGVLWRRVLVAPPSTKDMQCIVKAWYPSLEPVAEKIVATLESVKGAVAQQLMGFQPRGISHVASKFSLRDILKMCKRIVSLGLSFTKDNLSEYERLCIYHEAIDVFAAFNTSTETRLSIMKCIAQLWGLHVSVSEALYPVHKPVIQELLSEFRIGRIFLERSQMKSRDQRKPFVEIRSSLHTLERIASSVKFNEPVLLVGETGTGKTTLVQNLASLLGQRLTVLNLSQQTDISDLLGGFKPVDAQFICFPLYEEFKNLFSRTFSREKNDAYLSSIQKHMVSKNWEILLKRFQGGIDAYERFERSEPGRRRKRSLDAQLHKDWRKFIEKHRAAVGQIRASSSAMLFSFVEGAFVSAMRNGQWILLDEVNLAPPETLQRVLPVLEGETGSFCLAEKGDVDYVCRHPNFRIFACMNPATDAGKRDLPFSVRNRFTEYFVDDVLDDDDLTLFINKHIDGDDSLVSKIVHFYKEAKKDSEERLQDGANQRPQYSLRSLYRALEYTQKAKDKFRFEKALYDGFSMFFLNLLDGPSAELMKQKILLLLLCGKEPPSLPFDAYLTVQGYSRSDSLLKNYVLTKSVRKQLTNLARAIFIKRYPVLLQGPTSSGKTSLVQYLASITGHRFVRINNHEHTDLQEYLGSYINNDGKLEFREGVLVKAVRNGHWIVLDELNLAPSDVLEALNRLLDDNRELYVPELCETVCPHPDFMLFATQNPPTFYGGRKMLSRAFRNRFVEIHVDEIPEHELSEILEKRCKIPGSYAKKMVEVMKELQLQRQSSKVFAGKHGFITPRDLFRWADRFRTFGKSYEDLARDGYFLLADRLRNESEKSIVKDVLEKHLRVKIEKDNLYIQEPGEMDSVMELGCRVPESLQIVAQTKSMLRLYFLVERCYKLREPVLLVGETGCGKTTVCQLLSDILQSKLHILNCHQYTETSDFLGGFRPIRDRSALALDFKYLLNKVIESKAIVHFPGGATISLEIDQASSTLDQLEYIENSYNQGSVSSPSVTKEDLDSLSEMKRDLSELNKKLHTICMWQDGPLVNAMKNGDMLLVDEISLADDSVLERLNSVLEPERKLSLAEKGGSNLENIIADPGFFLLATMNPGGDYGKKELSPALRNRFTEIWVPPVEDLSELRIIASHRLSNQSLSYILDPLINFFGWFNQLSVSRKLNIRDLLSWIAFIDATERSLQSDYALLHGAFLVLLDGLSLGSGMSKTEAGELRHKCLSFLIEQLEMINKSSLDYKKLSRMGNYGWGDLETTEDDTSCVSGRQDENFFGISPFYIQKGCQSPETGRFRFSAATTQKNALRVFRAMQLSKPVLLEGSPGVGKTSLIDAIGKFSGHRVVRINLSDQTDIVDLLGADLPAESDEGFTWSDGILLQALKNGHWVLLDELNLAPQSVLEGLNAILDHRAEVYIPELGRTFKCPPSFRVFACQNPMYQGGGRKGLPRSFLNRFTKVYVDELVDYDYLCICRSLHPSIPEDLLRKLILFNKRLHEETMVYHKFGQDGSPWEFNLRDVLRACQLMEGSLENVSVSSFLNVVYVQRMRTAADRREVLLLFEQVFGVKPFINPHPRVQLNTRYLTVGNSMLRRSRSCSGMLTSPLNILPGVRHTLEAVAQCVQHERLCILIGPPSSGKTSLIQLLAQLTGNILNQINLSSVTDISDLLGCFEQYNVFRNFRSVIAQVESYVTEFFSFQLKSSSWETFIEARKDILGKWLSFLSSMDFGTMISESAFMENWKSISDSLGFLAVIIKQLSSDLSRICDDVGSSPFSWSSGDLSESLRMIKKAQETISRRCNSTKFEWVKGLLLKAIERGEWIVLENANLCNPTVLDRINSLVEESGSITVNERGIIDGNPVVVHPHTNFRMFLTVNPSYGEVSRAMRNRGIEIFMMQPYWQYSEENSCSFGESELEDLKRFLILSGIPFSKLIDLMARAHLYTRDQGFPLNVHITYVELARWVQLFQQLISNGNRPIWSLHISYEHTYLSTLGEAEGGEIVNHAKTFYLSGYEISPVRSLSLPGGWPAPLVLKDFMLYSKEASIRQNYMYLEYLGSHNASVARDKCTRSDDLTRTYLVDEQMLRGIMFPGDTLVMNACPDKQTLFDLDLANSMLFFASSWIIEQATENDIDLYVTWLSWFSFQLEPFNQFFTSFSALLSRELEHPIWDCIRCSRKEILSLYHQDMYLQSIPMLSQELAHLLMLSDTSKSACVRLQKATKCVGLLRLSFHQWNDESRRTSEEYRRCLQSLQGLEESVLGELLESPSFDVLFQLYTNLLDDHMQFWNIVTSPNKEHLEISWYSLVKDVSKLRKFCPDVVDTFLTEISDLVKIWPLKTQKPMLWKWGGHPYSSSSRDIYVKQQQFFELCEKLWPKQTKVWSKADAADEDLVGMVVSSNAELRSLALQGCCMSSCINSECDEHHTVIVHQLEEMYQMLSERAKFEKQKLDLSSISNENSLATVCCDSSLKTVTCKSGFNNWLDSLRIIDYESLFLDAELLQELSNIVLDDASSVQEALASTFTLLQRALSFSLSFSYRSPTDFLPHQKILWTLDAWVSVNGAISKIASSILEMWFKWHTSLWNRSTLFIENFSMTDGYNFSVAFMLLPVRAMATTQLLQSAFVIKDYLLYRSKVRVISHDLWQSHSSRNDMPRFLLSAARSLFKQIIYAHKKSFDANKYAVLKSTLRKTELTDNDVQDAELLIASSSHKVLTSLSELYINPLLKELFLQTSSTDFIFKLGSAWLRIGGMRFHLLLGIGDQDPVMKYSYKYSQIMKKISLVELEIKVREECDYLAGVFSTRQEERTNRLKLEKLNAERKRLQRKIVFRPDPAKFKKLKYECNAFLKFVMDIVTKNEGLDMHGLHNWQERATSFINRLSDEYGTYCDITQPIQVAVFEMKLGLSLVQSSALQRKILSGVEDNMNTVMEAIYSFMRFPTRCCSFRSEILTNNQRELFSFNISFQRLELTKEMELIEKLAKVTRGASMTSTVPFIQLEASIHQSFLHCILLCVAHTRLLDKDLFMLLDRIFDRFASHWLDMKTLERNREDHDAQQYKFRPRAFTIESIFEFDVSSPGSSTTSETFQEWHEFLSEGGHSERSEDSEDQAKLAEEQNLIPECVLQKLVQAHDQLFGSIDLVQNPGIMCVSAEDRLLSFVNSYSVGVDMVRGLDGYSGSCVDAKIIPEHVLRLCLEHEEKINFSRRSARSFNFYKDSNAPAMAKMVTLLMSLRERILILLNEWEEHPGLQKVLDIIDLLLAIPLSTSLAKALSGLQFLLARTQMLQENGSKFQLSDKLEPLIALVSSWKKIEFDSWPTLLDEVQDQCEINAGKLWFPLYSVLQHRHSSDITGCHQSIVESLEEFIQTSSIGEFKRRLHLLLAFHGQISFGIRLGTYSSSCHEKMLKILYNLFGYYMQFLPIIFEHLEASRKSVEEDLSKLLKLCRWERPESYISIENSRSARQKLKKLVQKYTDLLQQPVMFILTQEEARRGVEKEMTETLRAPTSSTRKDAGGLTDTKFEIAPFNEDRCMWYADWRKKVGQYCLDYLHMGRTAESISYFMGSKEANVNECISYINGWKGAWDTLEEISCTALHCGELWKDPKTTLGKRGALTLKQLLQLLNNSGLSKHKPVLFEFSGENHLAYNETSWCLQPAYVVQHLLLTHCTHLFGSPDLKGHEKSPTLANDSLGYEWQLANHFHFKSMASVELLKKVSLKHHKQFTLDQVRTTVSYLDHLITIQQEQRKVAYGFADQVTYFKNYLCSLENLYSVSISAGDDRTCCRCSIISNQPEILDCLWKQKEVFDSLSAALYDTTLLLKTLDVTHLQSCKNVKIEAIRLLNIIEKLMPICQNSKESLDNILIGQDRGGITLVANFQHLSVIPKKMEQLLLKNFKVLAEFEEHLSTLHEQEAVDRRAVEVTLVSHLEDIIKKGKEIEKALEGRIESDSSAESYPGLEAAYKQSLERIEKQVINTFQSLHSSRDFALLLEKGSHIPSWTAFFESFVRILQLDQLCDELLRTIYHAGKIVNHPACGSWKTSLSLDVGVNLKHLHESLDLMLRFSYGLLQDFLAMHKTIAMLSHTLADLFSSLYSKGFGSQEHQDEERSCDGAQDATGTGMGEGVGAKDVSDQISDEDQLLGAQKENEDQDASNQIPAKNDKGIEMEEDFTADTFSLSEDEAEDEDSNENGQNELDSAMGETGEDSAVTDAKLWDKNEDEDPSDRSQEKYETGNSIEDKDEKSRELRAREDYRDGNGGNDQGEDPDKLTDKDSQSDQETNNQEDGENVDRDADLDKEDDFADSSGLTLDDQNQTCEDMDMDKDDDANPSEEDGANRSEEDLHPADLGKSPEIENDEEDENINPEDTIEGGSEHGKDVDSQMNLEAQKNSDTMDRTNGNLQTMGYSFNSEEMKWSNSSDMYNDLAPVSGLPSNTASEMEITMEDSLGGSQLTSYQPESQFPQQDPTVPQKIQPNPYRDVGDALQDWKERVKVSIDLEENNMTEAPDDDNVAMDEDAAKEFGYVSQFEKGTSQALGAATSDQIDKNINDIRPDADDGHPPIKENDLSDKMEVDKERPMAKPFRHSSLVPETKLDEQVSVSDLEKLDEGDTEQLGYSDHDFKSESKSLVSVKKSYMNEEIHQLSELSLTDSEFGKAEDHDVHISSDATTLWRRYELLTSRMSQELTEQLRLVMEPTLASKLQGDYKTGKRINMKKVIPYIASHYRKDKIWLRRTRPNKRNYQVVIAVDDSRSMSESNCGNVAIEALVTVCRAMSQLEVGDLAVTSFGKKGNIRLLHDFGQPFTAEAGVKIISSLTFKQENTIADEPAVDILKYLNNMLDAAVANARLPSGQNPLQQLVLIIADGRFHEKDKLKRCVRDFLNGKRMVAFLLLDNSPQDSIMDVLEASYMKDGSMKLAKYLDSFPFPYYVVLRNIESLPRTLADLLRQWFELMQYSTE